MKLTYKEYLSIVVIIALLLMVMFWGIQKRRADSLKAERALSQGLQTQEGIEREYIPRKLNEKRSNDLTRMGTNLWGK